MTGKCFSGCNRGQRKKSDFYQTPYSLTRQLLDFEDFSFGKTHEPACGQGAISKVLEEYNIRGVSTDIAQGADFLDGPCKYQCNNIITNPPFSLSTEFIIKAKQEYDYNIAFLMPLSYLHGQRRYELQVFKELARVHIFTRYPLLTDTVRPDGKYNTGMMAYAWYVWEKKFQGHATIDWFNNNKYVLRKGDA